MIIEVGQRVQFFTTHAESFIRTYLIRSERSIDTLSSFRIAYLFSDLMIKMYSAEVGQDAFICFRDWAVERQLHCTEIDEMEYKNGKRVANPYFNPSKRVIEKLNFSKWTGILDEMICPERTPLIGRTPVRRMQ
jgi:hypothetical protein